ncbi:MAG TPA: tetratricopeptide repeat protein [Candidatus Limnocylindrales bacterium]|nr:tetratricopeptide repeat protein [Candidatus Limnocylindrales bacterium]
MISRRRRAFLLASGMAIAVVVGALVTLGAARQPIEEPSSPRPPAGAALTVLYSARAAQQPQASARAWVAMDDPLRGLPAAAVVSTSTDRTFLRMVADESIAVADWLQARVALERLLVLNPNDANAHLDLGLMLAASAPQRAQEHLQAAATETAYAAFTSALMEAARRSAEAAGWALFEQALWPYAELAFTTAAADLALSAQSLAALALSRDYQAKDGGVWMQRALERAPDDASVRTMQGIHLRLRGDAQGSLQALRSAAELAPDSTPILAQLGAAYQEMGEMEEAQRWYGLAQALAGDDPRYQALTDSLARTQDAALDAILGNPPIGPP